MAESALNTLLRGCASEAEKTLQRFEYQAKFVQQLVERYPEHKKLVEAQQQWPGNNWPREYPFPKCWPNGRRSCAP